MAYIEVIVVIICFQNITTGIAFIRYDSLKIH